jgi:hypothetical protein
MTLLSEPQRTTIVALHSGLGSGQARGSIQMRMTFDAYCSTYGKVGTGVLVYSEYDTLNHTDTIQR